MRYKKKYIELCFCDVCHFARKLFSQHQRKNNANLRAVASGEAPFAALFLPFSAKHFDKQACYRDVEQQHLSLQIKRTCVLRKR